MGDPVSFLKTLAVLFSSTKMTNYAITEINDTYGENGLGKMTQLRFTIMLETSVHKKITSKEW